MAANESMILCIIHDIVYHAYAVQFESQRVI